MQASLTPRCAPVSPTGAPLIALWPSVWLRSATLVCILIAVAAVQGTLAARLGALQAMPAALTALVVLTLAARLYWRAEPGAIKVGPDGVAVWNLAGRLVAQGRITGCSQWSDRLLILALAGTRGRSQSLVIPADALSTDAFRELAVLGRHGSRA
jgi:hypothetical protein